MISIRNNWNIKEVEELLSLPFNSLLSHAHDVHIKCHRDNDVQVCTLLSIKTGGCPEDCGYCSQSAHLDKPIDIMPLMELDEVKKFAEEAKSQGSTRFCMGAAWRRPTDKNIDRVIEMIKVVSDLGMESCVTLGMLTKSQAEKLSNAGLDYYNHNIDTSPEYYREIITTRTFEDRIETIKFVRDAGINVCSGGIIGMGESRLDRINFLIQLANLEKHPDSVPINMLVKVKGTKLNNSKGIDELEFVKIVCAARIMMPKSYVRLSAGRESMSQSMQALCFYAGANSVFYGEELLTTPNIDTSADKELFSSLGINIESAAQ
ncbi:MAG: biotin synthase BioB [Pseudomonadota bacterium]|nr:biotin synthase BioB [Pseudomonadota bacterium]|tara:strand:+ start:756 stop:1712 length:957 start_codon:yes stop_codon:yes gene_type:complete